MTDAEIAAPDLWDRLHSRMVSLVDDYQHAAEADADDLDAGWRALMRALVEAITAQTDDRGAALGIVAEALSDVASSP